MAVLAQGAAVTKLDQISSAGLQDIGRQRVADGDDTRICDDHDVDFGLAEHAARVDAAESARRANKSVSVMG